MASPSTPSTGSTASAESISGSLWLGLAIFLAAAGFRALVHFHKFDDAFITFRYARNLLHGLGMVYNPGERVLGTTTPLFTLLLAGLGFLLRTENFPALADWINRLADGGTAVLIFLIAARLWQSRALAVLAALFFAFSLHSVFYNSTGMETSFFTFLAVFSLERMMQGRPRASFLLAALALLTRPDALLLWMILLPLFFFRARARNPSPANSEAQTPRGSNLGSPGWSVCRGIRGSSHADFPDPERVESRISNSSNSTPSGSESLLERQPSDSATYAPSGATQINPLRGWFFKLFALRHNQHPRIPGLQPPASSLFSSLLPALGLLACAAAALFSYFGSVIPHSMLAKTVLCPSSGDLRLFDFPNRYDVMMFWAGFLSKTHFRQAWPNTILLFPTAALFGAGLFELARRDRRVLALPALALLFFAAYAKSPVFMFPWYLIPTVPAMILTIFAGLKLAATRLARILHRDETRCALAAVAIVLGLQSLCFISAGQAVPSAVARTMYPQHLEPAYRAAIARVAAESPRARVLTPEIGFIGWYGPQTQIIDAGGLTCPALVRFHKTHRGFMKNNELVNRAIIDRFRPDWIITLRTFFDESLPLAPDFQARYEPIEISTKDSERPLLFRRRQ